MEYAGRSSVAFGCAALVAWAVALPAAASEQPRPNIIFILADDLGYECIGANGGQSYKTPCLDAIARDGVRFTHCYSTPLCTPSRVQLMTGMYNVRNYVSFGVLEDRQTTFAHLLKSAGYATCIAGKWQLGGLDKMNERARHFGFDESYLYSWYAYYWSPSIDINGVMKDYPQDVYGPDAMHELIRGFLETNREKPFFLYYTMALPHDPFLPTPDSGVAEPWRVGENPSKQGPRGTPEMHKKGQPKYYGDMVAYMDKLVGRLSDTLKELGLAENTLVIFTGDNGSPTGKALLDGKTVVAGKNLMTDAGTHAPLFVRWPAGGAKVRVCEDLIDFTDILPTVCDAAGVAIPATLEIDGHSFVPQIRGERGTPREWCYCWFTKYPAEKAAREWARNQRYKLYRTGELYDISEDVMEQRPLDQPTAEAKEARVVLQRALDRYRDARPAEWVAKEAQQRMKKAAR